MSDEAGADEEGQVRVQAPELIRLLQEGTLVPIRQSEIIAGPYNKRVPHIIYSYFPKNTTSPDSNITEGKTIAIANYGHAFVDAEAWISKQEGVMNTQSDRSSVADQLVITSTRIAFEKLAHENTVLGNPPANN